MSAIFGGSGCGSKPALTPDLIWMFVWWSCLERDGARREGSILESPRTRGADQAPRHESKKSLRAWRSLAAWRGDRSNASEASAPPAASKPRAKLPPTTTNRPNNPRHRPTPGVIHPKNLCERGDPLAAWRGNRSTRAKRARNGTAKFSPLHSSSLRERFSVYNEIGNWPNPRVGASPLFYCRGRHGSH